MSNHSEQANAILSQIDSASNNSGAALLLGAAQIHATLAVADQLQEIKWLLDTIHTTLSKPKGATKC